nr:putative ribonuclease H-like domain-containing protein [Tanacetum cinerariifolium]
MVDMKLKVYDTMERNKRVLCEILNDYGGATQDRKSTTGGCQFLGRRLISWQCKKQTIVATSTTEAEYVAAASCCGQVLWIQNQLLDYGDYFEKKLISVDHIHTDENVAYLLTKPFDAGRFQYLVSENNVDFHPIVDFVEASPLRYALTVKPTVYVSHIRQFWSTARIKKTEDGTKILATIDGILRTVTKSSLRRNLKLQDEEGISSLPNTELFEKLTLMGYNISPNQKFTFQKGQFSHQWKYLIHTIMQCLSPKSTWFNEFSSNIAIALVCLATNRTYNFSKLIFDGLVKNVNNKGEGSGTPTKPHHTPSPEAHLTSHTTHSSPTLPPVTTASILTDRANIAKTSTLPHDSVPRVTSPAADEGSMQLKLDELMGLCTSMQRQHSEMFAKFEAHEMEINGLKARVKLLEDRDRVAAERSGDDAPIKRRNFDEGEEVAQRVSDDTEEMATVLTSMETTTILASRATNVPTGSGSIPTAGSPAAEVPTGSDVVPTASPVFATATVVTPYRRRKGKEIMVESKTPKKKEVQEQIDAHVVRELEEQMAREDQRMSEQVARDAEVARIHAKEELQMMINSLDRSNETVLKYLQELNKESYGLRSKRGITTWHSSKIEYFIPIGSKEEAERFKRKGIRFEQESVKKLKTSEEVPEEVKTPDEVPEEKHMDREDLNQLWALVKESLSNRQPTSDKEMELWVELKRSYKPDNEDQLWTHTQNLIHAPVEWKLYDLCGVHQGKIVRNKMHKEFPLPVIEFPLAEEVLTASEESSYYQKKRDATAKRIALLSKSQGITVSQRHIYVVQRRVSVSCLFRESVPRLLLDFRKDSYCRVIVQDSLCYKRSP